MYPNRYKGAILGRDSANEVYARKEKAMKFIKKLTDEQMKLLSQLEIKAIKSALFLDRNCKPMDSYQLGIIEAIMKKSEGV